MEKIADNDARESVYKLAIHLIDSKVSRDTAILSIYRIVNGCGGKSYSRSICSTVHAAYDDASKEVR